MYFSEDKVVGSDGAIYSCTDIDFCDEDPVTDDGKMGWEKTPFKTAGIKNYTGKGKQP
jgi:hypothetical protein